MRPFFVDPRDIRNVGLYFLFCAVLPLAWIVVALYNPIFNGDKRNHIKDKDGPG